MGMLLRRHRQNAEKSSDQSKTTQKAKSSKEDNDGKTGAKSKKKNK